MSAYRFSNSQHNRLHSSKLISRLLIGCISLATLYIGWAIYHIETPKHLHRKEKQFTVLDWSAYSNNKHEDRIIGNCFVTRNKEFLNVSDAVVITNRKQLHISDFPTSRRRWQRWVWILDESPYHPFDGNDFAFSHLNGLFNWTMTYRTKSDVYIPYGRTMRKANSETYPDLIGKQPKLAVAVVSNCDPHYVQNGRYKYIQQLQTYSQVDVFGKCSGIPCEGYKTNQQTGPCPKVKEYLFYLAFENSNCREYISEKIFSHGFDIGVVPVVMGAPKEDYARMCPPNSFIHVNDFKSPEMLANYLKSLSANRSQYMKFHKWRREFTTSYRIQFIHDNPLWEALCSVLSKREGEVNNYPDLGQFWTKDDCEPAVGNQSVAIVKPS